MQDKNNIEKQPNNIEDTKNEIDFQSNEDTNNLESKKKDKKKINKITTAFMFTGLIGSIAIIPITSIIFSFKRQKKTKYLFDNLNNDTFSIKKEEIKKDNNNLNKQKYTFILENEINANDLFDLDSKILIQTNNKEKRPDYQIDLSKDFSFYRFGYRFDSFFKDNKPQKNELPNNAEDILIDTINLVDSFNKIKEDKKYNIDFKYFIQQILSLKLSFAYSFRNKKDNKFYFFDTKGKLAGFEFKNFFSEITKYINKNIQNKEINNPSYEIKTYVSNKDGIINKLKFKINLSFEA